MPAIHSRVRCGQALRRGLAVVAIGIAALTACQPTPHLDLTVTTAADGSDANPGDAVCEAHAGQGDCTLRAAIEATNGATSDDIVRIAPGIDPVWTGDLPAVTSTLDLVGNGTTLHGHLAHTGGALTLRSLTITGVHTPAGCGGAITSTGTRLTVVGVTISANQTDGNHGGGICTGTATALNVLASTITGNQVRGSAAGASGGGIRAASAVTITNSTVTANSSFGLGEGIEVVGSGPLMVTSSTISGGTSVTAPNATGRLDRSTVGSMRAGSTLTVAGSIIGSCIGSAPSSGGYNLVQTATCGPAGPTDRIDAAAPIGGLADNGGPTATALPVLAGKALDAIPAGTVGLCDGSSTTDQRGLARPAHGRCDIGSVELQSGFRVTAPVQLDPIGSTGDIDGNGRVVGETRVITNPFTSYAVRWVPGGARTIIGPQDATGSKAWGANASGTIVGMSGSHAARWNPTTLAQVDLGTLPGDTSSFATAINAGGTIVGGSQGANGTTRPVTWDAATLTIHALPTLGGSAGVSDVNDAGVAVGWSVDAAGVQHAVRWDLAEGTIASLGTVPGGTYSAANAINEAGTIVGQVARPDLPDPCANDTVPWTCDATRAFTWTAATGMREIPSLGPVGSATGIDDRGYVLVRAEQMFVSCAGCPHDSSVGFVVDPTTGERMLLSNTELIPTDLDGAVLVGNGRHVELGVDYSIPMSMQVTILP